MARDQFSRVSPGDQLAGLPSQPWNRMLDLVRPGAGGGAGPGAGGWTPVEFPVVNTTASALAQFGILQVGAPLVTHATDAEAFKAQDILKGIAPAADKPFVVFQEPVSAGGVGVARILGLTKVLVNITNAAHRFAGPTTSTTKLTSAVSGPVEIIHPPAGGSGSGAGDQWCTVLLGGAGSGGDDIDLAELNNSGTTPPAGWLDARTLLPDPATKTLSVIENIWLWDATT
jgi:hypothetical protein